jgi:hypothetical protein
MHSSLEYLGMYSVRDTDNKASMQTAKAVEGAKRFERVIAGEIINLETI